jgi:hypothetical protein
MDGPDPLFDPTFLIFVERYSLFVFDRPFFTLHLFAIKIKCCVDRLKSQPKTAVILFTFSNAYQLEAMIYVLGRKELLTKEEVLEALNGLSGEK